MSQNMITIDSPTIPPWAESQLLTIGGRSELLFVYRQDKQTLSKFVSPEDVARAYGKVVYDTGDIPPGIMRMGNGPKGCWGILKTVPQLVRMSFLDDDPITVPIPGTIMLGYASTYLIFAERAGKVCQAPFDNVYSDGRICWGNNRIPAVKRASDILKAWNLFWLIPFTHRNDANGGQLTYKGVYETLAKRKAKKYSLKLKDSKMTINKMVRMATGQIGEIDD